MTKKILIALTFTMTLICFSPLPANAMISPPKQINMPDSNIATPASEQTEWIFRVNDDGTYQMRLWSITRRIWLTDWIDVT